MKRGLILLVLFVIAVHAADKSLLLNKENERELQVGFVLKEAAMEGFGLLRGSYSKGEECFSCLQNRILTKYSSYWCLLDSKCHTTGSFEGACVGAGNDDQCISQGHSMCQIT